MTAAAFIQLGARLMLVILFLPFSALDKIFNFRGAVGQAKQETPWRPIAVLLVIGGLAIEIFMSLAILTGIMDRLAAVILAIYCILTACLWKQFWNPPPHQALGARDLFWDFLKNFSLAGGFLLVALGTTASSVRSFIADPFSSTHPYQDIRP
ncbi:MAG TPA: DoxX family protein [Rhizomicrobium sp.]|nr:DoxX family protein [Rhizomicrobium sp.]